MYIDSGADMTLVPSDFGKLLGMDLSKNRSALVDTRLLINGVEEGQYSACRDQCLKLRKVEGVLPGFSGLVGLQADPGWEGFCWMGQWRSQDFRDLLGALQGFRISSETGRIEPHCLPGEIESRCGQTSQRVSCSEEHQGPLWWAEGIS